MTGVRRGASLPRALLPITLALACAPARVPPPPARPAAAHAALAPEVRERVEISNVACHYTSGVAFSSEGPLSLCFDGGAPCWAEVVDDPVRHATELVLEAKDRGRALVRLRYEGLRLAGFVPRRALLLFPARPLVLGGYFIPERLRIGGGKRGAVFVEALADPALTPAAPLMEARACDELSTAGSWFSPEELATFAMGKPAGEDRLLTPGQVPVSITARGAAAATLTVEEDLWTTAFEQEGDRTRIFLYLESGRVFGWVPSRSLVVPPGKPGVGHGSSGRGHAWLVGPDPAPGHVCAGEVPLFARVGDRLVEVGAAEARQTLSLGAIEGPWVHVGLRHRVAYRDEAPSATRVLEGLRLAPGAALLARGVDVERCEARGGARRAARDSRPPDTGPATPRHR